MNRYMTDKFAGTILGVNTFRLRQFPDGQLGNVTDSTWRVWRRRPRVTYEDAQAVMRGVTIPVSAAWESSTRAALTAGRRQAKDVEVTAAPAPYSVMRPLGLERGRAFTAEEGQAGVPVLVLGHELADKLFEGQDPLGREAKIFDLPYRVIGIVEKQGNLFGLSLDKFAVAPATAPLKRYINQPRVVDALAMKAHSQLELREAMSQAEAVMRTRRHLRPREPNDFALETADEVLDFWANISRVLFVALPGLVAPRRGAAGGRCGIGGGRVPGAPRPAARPDRRLAARDMTPLFEGVGVALDSLRAHKGRAALTIMGVAIGVAVVMVIAALISGINRSVSNIFESIAPRTFLVWRFFQAGVNVSDGSDESSPWRRNPELTGLEANRIALLPSVRYVTRRDESSATVEFRDVRLESVEVSGLSAPWVEVNGGDVYPGRTFTRPEGLASSPVAVSHRKLEDQLFRGRDPIDQSIHVAGAPFTVIGVYTPPPSLFSGSTPPFVGIPHGAFAKHVPYFKGWMRLAGPPPPPPPAPQARGRGGAAARPLRRPEAGRRSNI